MRLIGTGIELAKFEEIQIEKVKRYAGVPNETGSARVNQVLMNVFPELFFHQIRDDEKHAQE